MKSMINDCYTALSTADLFYEMQEDLEEADFQKVQLIARKFQFRFLKCHWNKAYISSSLKDFPLWLDKCASV